MTGKKTCFVVGPIGEAGSIIRQKADWLLKGIIRPVLEANELGYKVKRADDDADPGSITNALINDVIHSDLVVADLTGFNPNAFYELGIRHAVQKPTIHIIAEAVRLPFDNTDQRTIFVDISDFDSVESAKKQLLGAALAVTKEGYRVTNPVTKAGGVADLRMSHDPKDKILIDLVEKVSKLEKAASAPAIIGQGRLATLSDFETDRLFATKIAENLTNNADLAKKINIILRSNERANANVETDVEHANEVIRRHLGDASRGTDDR